MPTQNKRLLIIEDEEVMRETLAERFGKEAFDVFQAKDGRKGLADALELKPDVILLDIMMPKLDGMDVLERIRMASDWGKSVPVVVLTNLNVDDNTLKTIINSQPSSYLLKTDWDLDQVVGKTKEILGLTESEE